MGNAINPYWRVNSYGYPNRFSSEPRAIQAWQVFESFYRFSSYHSLKAYWASQEAPRILHGHAVESWKATFEEFGLLYVLSGRDTITITPGGIQFINAAEAGRELEFGWIGLNLLLRYPLGGFRRRTVQSDLLLYWFFYAALRETRNYYWWSELEKVLCKIFLVKEASRAVDLINQLRSGTNAITDIPSAGPSGRGDFYNVLNQVIVHAGMNYLLLNRSTSDSFYPHVSKEPCIQIIPKWVEMIDVALGGATKNDDCENQTTFISRMPSAPKFDKNELDYFAYLGAEVHEIKLPSTNSMPSSHIIDGGNVALLKQGIHYIMPDNLVIEGSIAQLCQLSKGQRLILSHDTQFSYIVENKIRIDPYRINIKLRRGRPITNSRLIVDLLRGEND